MNKKFNSFSNVLPDEKGHDKIIKILSQKKIINNSLINKISHPLIKILSCEYYNNSVLLRLDEKFELGTYIFIDDKNDIPFILEKLTNKDKRFPHLEDWLAPYLLKNNEKIYYETYHGLSLSDDVKLRENKLEDRVEPIKLDDMKLVNDRWPFKKEWSLEYLKYQVENDISGAIYENNCLVAWCLIHDDGAIGSLWIEPEYRKRNYATAISNYMIKKLRDQKRIPFSYISLRNEKSLNLAQKTGFVRRTNYCWLKLK